MAWLLDAHLLDSLTKPEWSFVATGEGDQPLVRAAPGGDLRAGLAARPGAAPRPDGAGAGHARRPAAAPAVEGDVHGLARRTNPTPAPAPEAAIVLDLFYCLDWAYLEARAAADPPARTHRLQRDRPAPLGPGVGRGHARAVPGAARATGKRSTSRPEHAPVRRRRSAPGVRVRRRRRSARAARSGRAAGCSQAGAHQFHRPSRVIVAGTSRQRTIGRVDQHGDGQAEPDLLDVADPGRGEAAEHDHHEQRGRGDDPPGVLQPAPHRGVGRHARVDVLLDPAEQEDLVVHGQPEREREDDHDDERVERADRQRVQQVRWRSRARRPRSARRTWRRARPGWPGSP